ncbi:MAG: ABC transporter ATP-binding protein/permease [Lachnospiraceae bacterium]
MENKKKYSLREHYRYTFQCFRKTQGDAALAVCVGDMALSVLLPFLEAALAGAVAACLVSGRQTGEILLMMAAYMILLQLVRFMQSHFRALRVKTLFMFRCKMGPELDQKTLDMDGQKLESAQGQKKRMKAFRNLYTGNEFGIEAFAAGFWDALIQLGGLAVYGAVIGRYSRILFFFLFSEALLTAWLHSLAGRKMYCLEEDNHKSYQGLQYLRRESIAPGNGKDIRMYRLDRWFLREFRERIDQITARIDQGEKQIAAAKIAGTMLAFGRNVIVYGWMIREMALGNLTLPVFLLYVGVVAGVESWMNGLFEAMQTIYRNREVMDSYRDFMEFGRIEERSDALKYPGSVHEIRLEHVSFRYEENKEDTIHDLSLTIRAGERLALVGLNGAGKTTLIKLICGLYRPTAGRIFLDGQDLQTLPHKEVFREFAVVFQDVFAFSFPLAENVSCVAKGQEEEKRLRESLQKAGLWEKASSLPRGTATAMNRDLDEAGVSLSGGELQKLMLARALYKDAPVVILDEPTAALDPIAESEMYEKYDAMIREKTGIFISHRLSSTRFCDRILFLEEGRIIEEGSHAKLMEQEGAYAKLFDLQARYYQKKREEEEIYGRDPFYA